MVSICDGAVRGPGAVRGRKRRAVRRVGQLDGGGPWSTRRCGAALGGGGRLAPLLQEVEEARVPPLERAQQPLGSEVAAHLGEGRGTAASEAQGGSLLWVAARSCSAELQPWVAALGCSVGAAAWGCS